MNSCHTGSAGGGVGLPKAEHERIAGEALRFLEEIVAALLPPISDTVTELTGVVFSSGARKGGIVKINRLSGDWFAWRDDARGSDLTSLASYVLMVDLEEAARRVSQFLNALYDLRNGHGT